MLAQRAVLFLAAVLAASAVYAASPVQVFERASPSVVTIASRQVTESGISLGSGVVVAPGQVVTNCHVVEDADAIAVKHGKQILRASIRYARPDLDLCQLSVPQLKAPAARISGAGRLKIGQTVYAIGAPEGLELTLSNGLVAGLREVKSGKLIQTTAAISMGSSGGGLFDEEGRLVGITTFYVDGGQSLNFALPAEWLRQLPSPQAQQNAARMRATQSASRYSQRFAKLHADGQSEQALALAREWVAAEAGSAVAWLALGQALILNRQPEQAVVALEKSIQLDPRRSDAWNALGLLHLAGHNYEKAVTSFQNALALLPKDPAILYNLGRAQAQAGDLQGAREVQQVLTEVDPERAQKLASEYLTSR